MYSQNREYNNHSQGDQRSSNPFANHRSQNPTESNQYRNDRSQNYQNAPNPYENAGFKNPMYQNQSYGQHQISAYSNNQSHSSSNYRNQGQHQQSFSQNNYGNNFQSSYGGGGGGGQSRAFVDWDDLKDCIEKDFSAKPAVIKNFYNIHPELELLKKEDVLAWRKENHDITLTSMSSNPDTKKAHTRIKPCTQFHQAFGDEPDIMKTIRAQGFEKPTPIQAQIWPAILQGFDTVGIAQTGTGKTLAFLMPMFIHIMSQQTPLKQRKGPSALILSPTRELALQIESEILKYKYRGLRVACVYGGGNKGIQLRAIASGVEIIVATPGRMNDLLNQGMISLEDVTYVVLDEADRMLDMGFEPQILKILLEIRKDRQTIMTSATWPKGVRSLVKSYMIDPLQVVVGSLDLTGVNTVAQNIRIVETDGTVDYQGNPQYKNNKMKELKQICTKMFDKSKDKMIIFVATKRGADNLCHKINMKMAHDSRRPIADAIHGDRSQKEREYTLSRFREGRMKIMVATDVASRGIDVQDVTFVVNYDFPGNVEEYVHRIGRTGRAGQKGTAISFFTRDNQTSAKELIEILKKTPGTEIPSELVRYAQDSRRPSKNSKNKMQFRTGSLHEQRSFRKY